MIISMLPSANGRRRASPQTASLTEFLLATASSHAASRPIVLRSRPRSLAIARARHGMSPRPVPTSSSVASRPSAPRASSISSIAALIPPNSALARATSASERVTIAGSTSGESSISTPLLRGGVKRSSISVLQLRVPAAIIEERSPCLRAGRFHFADDDRMVATIVGR